MSGYLIYPFFSLKGSRTEWLLRTASIAALVIPAVPLVCGWGAGCFLARQSPRSDAFVVWALVTATGPALLACLREPESA